MVDNDYNRNIDEDQYGRRKQNNTFDDEYVEEDVDAIQDPYPSDDIVDTEDMIDDEAEDREESDIHEYEDNDHPHEYKSPTAVIDNRGGS